MNFGQMSQCSVSFNSAPLLIVLEEKMIDSLCMHAVIALVVRGDTVIKGSVEVPGSYPTNLPAGTSYCGNVESIAIAHVCY